MKGKMLRERLLKASMGEDMPCRYLFLAMFNDDSPALRGIEASQTGIFVGKHGEHLVIAGQTAEVPAPRLAVHFTETDTVEVDDFHPYAAFCVTPAEDIAAAVVGMEPATFVHPCRGGSNGAKILIALLHWQGNDIHVSQRTGGTQRGIVTVGEEETATLPRIAYCSVGNADGTLPLLRCEGITVDEIKLGSRAVALAEHPLGDGGAYAGLWCEGCEKGEKHGELAQNAVA